MSQKLIQGWRTALYNMAPPRGFPYFSCCLPLIVFAYKEIYKRSFSDPHPRSCLELTSVRSNMAFIEPMHIINPTVLTYWQETKPSHRHSPIQYSANLPSTSVGRMWKHGFLRFFVDEHKSGTITRECPIGFTPGSEKLIHNQDGSMNTFFTYGLTMGYSVACTFTYQRHTQKQVKQRNPEKIRIYSHISGVWHTTAIVRATILVPRSSLCNSFEDQAARDYINRSTILKTKSSNLLNSLWPSDNTDLGQHWRQVMACSLTTPSHYLKLCWHLVSEVL